MGWAVFIILAIFLIIVLILNARLSRGVEKPELQRTAATVTSRRLTKEVRIHQLLNLAYSRKQRLRMKYETSNPLPGDPAIKIRDIEIYGLGDDYFEAYCYYRSQVRVFKVSRILGAHLVNETYRIPDEYTPSSWVTEGWGEVDDSRLESIEEVPQKPTTLTVSREAEDKYRPGVSLSEDKDLTSLLDKQDKQQRVSKETTSYGRSVEGTKTYVRYDWQKQFEESIHTLFPEEWSPALPYLYEAHRLEQKGASPEKIQEVLEKARQADSDATSFYIGRLSIIKKRKRQNR